MTSTLNYQKQTKRNTDYKHKLARKRVKVPDVIPKHRPMILSPQTVIERLKARAHEPSPRTDKPTRS